MNVERKESRTTLSQHQKFNKALTVARELPSLTSEVGKTEFEECLNLLKDIGDLWANGRKDTMQAVAVDETGLICKPLYVDLSDVIHCAFAREWRHF